MKHLYSWLCACLMLIGSVSTAAAYALLPQGQDENAARQLPTTLQPQSEEDSLPNAETRGNTLVATIRGIDRQHGVLYLQTEFGNMVTWAEPKDLQNLHAGDQVVLYLEEENPKDNADAISV